MNEHDEDEQDPEGHGGDHEEVDGHEVLHVVVEESPPGLQRSAELTRPCSREVTHRTYGEEPAVAKLREGMAR
jgi:hypothetical protein